MKIDRPLGKSSSGFKLRALALECEGRPKEARRMWLRAAARELRALSKVEDAGFRAGIGEVVACLASAAATHRQRPLLKEGVRAVVKRFLDRVGLSS